MTSLPGAAALRANSTRYGVVIIVAGVVLLLGLRLWASPLTRRMTGRGSNGLLEFLMIPAFFVIVAAGTALFLWEPDR